MLVGNWPGHAEHLLALMADDGIILDVHFCQQAAEVVVRNDDADRPGGGCRFCVDAVRVTPDCH